MKFFLIAVAIIYSQVCSFSQSFPLETKIEWAALQKVKQYGGSTEVVWKGDSCFLNLWTSGGHQTNGEYVKWLTVMHMEPATSLLTYKYTDKLAAQKMGTTNFIVIDNVINYGELFGVNKPEEFIHEYKISSRDNENVNLSLTDIKEPAGHYNFLWEPAGYFELQEELFCYFQDGDLLKIRTLDRMNQKRSFDFGIADLFGVKGVKIFSIYLLPDSDKNKINAVIPGTYKEAGKDILSFLHITFDLASGKQQAESYAVDPESYSSDLLLLESQKPDSILHCVIEYADVQNGKLDHVSFRMDFQIPQLSVPGGKTMSDSPLFAYKNEDGNLKKIFSSRGPNFGGIYYAGKFKEGMLFISDGSKAGFNRSSDQVDYSEIPSGMISYSLVISYVDSAGKVYHKPLKLSGLTGSLTLDITPSPESTNDVFKAYVNESAVGGGKIKAINIGKLTIQ